MYHRGECYVCSEHVRAEGTEMPSIYYEKNSFPQQYECPAPCFICKVKVEWGKGTVQAKKRRRASNSKRKGINIQIGKLNENLEDDARLSILQIYHSFNLVFF